MVTAQKNQANVSFQGGLHELAKKEYDKALELLFATIEERNLNITEHEKYYILASKLMGNVGSCEIKEGNYTRAIQVLRLAIRYDLHSHRTRKYEARIELCQAAREEKEEKND